MEKFIVSARKYRPQTFESVVGQQHIVRTLKNAIKTGQLAHAYLFCGPRGVGKTTTARIFAKTINCQNITPDIEPCNQCASCRAFNEGKSLNIHELDAASNNSVEDIRRLIEQVRIPPQNGKYKVYIIDEVHMLSQAAFNAFLKTLEEPPKHAIFILATTEKHKIIPTILSRCQIFDFNRIKIKDIVEHLKKIAQKENIKAEPEALNIIAQKADGALRDALSYFDQIASFSDKNITYQQVLESLNVLDYDYFFKITENALKENYSENLLIFDKILAKGFDEHNFIVGLEEHFRNLLVIKDTKTADLLELGDNIKEKYLAQAKQTSVKFLFKAIEICNNADINYAKAKNKRLHVELMLLKLSQIITQLEEEQKKILINQELTTPQTNTEIQQKQIKNSPDSFSIKDALGSKPKILTTNENKAKQEQNQKLQITQENILKVWKQLKDIFKSRPRLAAMFNGYQPKIDTLNNIITIEVYNQSQKEQIINIKKYLEKFFAEKFTQKITINISLQEIQNKKQHNKAITPEQKYNFLREKNPNIDKLSEKFGLKL